MSGGTLYFKTFEAAESACFNLRIDPNTINAALGIDGYFVHDESKDPDLCRIIKNGRSFSRNNFRPLEEALRDLDANGYDIVKVVSRSWRFDIFVA
jgi:hypothetical protein